MIGKCAAVLLAIVLATTVAHAASCQLTTYNQTAWGTSPSGNNSAAYRNTHFGTAFPSGVRIGVEPLTAHWTSSRAVQLFLPQTGTPAMLNASSINATTTSAKSLAGEALTLTLNIGFDAADPDFGESEKPLSELTVANGPCSGMKVSEVLGAVNQALVGQGTLSVQEALSCAKLVNDNFEAGIVNRGNLSCEEQTPPVKNESVQIQNISGTISIARWYPKGTHYVFFCNASGAANYSWYFGDGQKLLQIKNDNVYHIFPGAGVYDVQCIGHGAQNRTANLQVII